MRFVKNITPLLFFIVILSSFSIILSSPVHAWTRYTQEYMANSVCSEFSDCNGKYNDLVKSYSMYPDRWYTYPFTYKYHYNSYIDINCTKGDWVCPDYYNQGALKGTAMFLNISHTKTGSEKWKYIAIAGHYFFESEEFWHKVRQEDYFACHKKMEQLFDKEFLMNHTDFVVCTCNICENSTRLFELKKEFIEYIKDNSTPQDYKISRLSVIKRMSVIMQDWKSVAMHTFTDSSPTVPVVIDAVAKTISNETSIPSIQVRD